MHLTAEMFNQMVGTNIALVPYRGIATVVIDLVGSHVALGIIDPPSGMTAIQASKLGPPIRRKIASAERHYPFGCEKGSCRHVCGQVSRFSCSRCQALQFDPSCGSARSRLYSATSRHCGEGKGAERVPPSLREVLSSHRASNAATVTPLLPNRSGGGTGATLHSHERFLVGSVNVLFVHMRKGAKGGINDVQVTPLTTPTCPFRSTASLGCGDVLKSNLTKALATVPSTRDMAASPFA